MNIIVAFFLLLFPSGTQISTGSDKLSESEKEGILLMREEEKLAHDIYLSFSEQWNIPIFNNIGNSETRHFEAVGFLLNEFGLNDPAFKKAGKFRNREIAQLYDSLTQSGNQSLVNALKAGALFEELDIEDLQRLITETDNETIISVYENLLRASGNHLRAFTWQLSFRDIDYSPTVLSADEFQNIIVTPHQGGNSMGNCMMQPINKSTGKGKMLRRRGHF